jgi:hypothetical protein
MKLNRRRFSVTSAPHCWGWIQHQRRLTKIILDQSVPLTVAGLGIQFQQGRQDLF